MTAEELLRALAAKGGCIVPSSSCSPLEWAEANAENNACVLEDGLGFVLRPVPTAKVCFETN